MKLLIVIPRQSHTTGNHVTAARFADQLQLVGWDVRRVEAGQQDAAPIAAEINRSRPDVVLLLHAWRSGQPWLQLPDTERIPFAVLMTGTDLNRDLDIPQRAEIINRLHQGAAGVIVQNRIAWQRLQKEQPPWLEKLRLLPPGIQLGTEESPLRDQLRIEPETRLLLHPASIRPVKGNLELLEMCDFLAETPAPAQLIFCGPILDRAYGEQLLSALKNRPWASYPGEIPCAAMPSVMRQADLILNNSSSEGVANALVEAATLGRPILASDIPGNRAVVRPGENGLLYRTAEEFTRQVRRLLDQPDLLHDLSRPDPTGYSASQEGMRLAAILKDLLDRDTVPGTD